MCVDRKHREKCCNHAKEASNHGIKIPDGAVAYQGTIKRYMTLSERFEAAGLSVCRHMTAQIESSAPYAPVFRRWQVLIGADATDMAVGCCYSGEIYNPNAKP